MARWRVDIFRKVLATLGTVEAPDEKSAIAMAIETFKIPPARRNKITVSKISERDD